MGLIKIFIISLILFGFVNTFERSDFINIIVPTIILLTYYTTLNRDVMRHLQMFLIAIGATLAYDLLWLFFSSGVSNILYYQKF